MAGMTIDSTASTAPSADFIVIRAGIAGASVAYWLAPHGQVLQAVSPGARRLGADEAHAMVPVPRRDRLVGVTAIAAPQPR